MPRSKAAEKAVRSSERRRLRNRAVKSMTKTTLTKAQKALAGGDLEAAQSAVAVSIKSLDKAAKKGVIHSNTADRRKSRLMKRLNKVTPAPAAKSKTRSKASKAARASKASEAPVVPETTEASEAESEE